MPKEFIEIATPSRDKDGVTRTMIRRSSILVLMDFRGHPLAPGEPAMGTCIYLYGREVPVIIDLPLEQTKKLLEIE